MKRPHNLVYVGVAALCLVLAACQPDDEVYVAAVQIDLVDALIPAANDLGVVR